MFVCGCPVSSVWGGGGGCDALVFVSGQQASEPDSLQSLDLQIADSDPWRISLLSWVLELKVLVGSAGS